ncbi:hypothetical protein B0H17DRAFT_1077406 [Mycena rosella]|uniref:Uncharacterized protein n=1 Tax=Mycena rosella TaxID=1033263 RepID=A0AAD7BTB2_MYCRO|nr:hypothetical protein B0H17DRAFT_1109331 [Mycena rosella]KAJ7679981.1 hypothetical protein B0H17DRAFT_1077406 [Mycena rosella]
MSSEIFPPEKSSSTTVEGISMTDNSSSVHTKPSVKVNRSPRNMNLRSCRISIVTGERDERRKLSVSLLDENTRSQGTAEA